ncbi:hypothetical protein KI387_005992, partial [Taxus chinensis]
MKGSLWNSSNSHMTIREGVIKEEELVVKRSKAMTLAPILKNQLHKALWVTIEVLSAMVTSIESDMHIFRHRLSNSKRLFVRVGYDSSWSSWTALGIQGRLGQPLQNIVLHQLSHLTGRGARLWNDLKFSLSFPQFPVTNSHDQINDRFTSDSAPMEQGIKDQFTS